MKPTCVELFAGAGGASVGLHKSGFRSLLAVEWDKAAAATLTAAALSDRVVCGDVRDASLYAGLRGRVDLLWSSPPCFPAGALVATIAGPRPIESLLEGVAVLTHRGRYRRVITKMVKSYQGDLVVLDTVTRPNTLRCTPEHPIYTRRYVAHDESCYAEPAWVPAEELLAWDLVLEPRLGGAEEWVFIKSVKREWFEGDVHNVEVEEDNSYTVNAVAVHNCQAWSIIGKQLGAFDERNGWPWTWDVVDRIQPRWLLCENVLGILTHRSDCASNNSRVPAVCAADTVVGLFGDESAAMDTFESPEDCPGCYWERAILVEARQRYAHVDFKILNAADYGVPQLRQRIILAAGPQPFVWPTPTHSIEALVYAKWHDGSYWKRHGVPPSSRATPAERNSLPRHKPSNLPWMTSRDVMVRHPFDADKYGGLWVKPHQIKRTLKFQGGMEKAQMNPDMPSLTVTCRRGGAKTNDALIWDEGGQLRYLTIAEVAALQGFPTDHPWQGSTSAKYKQVGNAVPPPMAEALGRAILVG